jgi:hemolysin activation/secretion protein
MVHWSSQTVKYWLSLNRRSRYFSKRLQNRQVRLLHFIFTVNVFACISAPNIGAQTLRADLLDAQHIQRQQQQQQFLESRLPSADITPLVPDIPATDRTRYPAEAPCYPITDVTLSNAFITMPPRNSK